MHSTFLVLYCILYKGFMIELQPRSINLVEHKYIRKCVFSFYACSHRVTMPMCLLQCLAMETFKATTKTLAHEGPITTVVYFML